MDTIKHVATSLKEKLTGHRGRDHKHDAHSQTPSAEVSPQEARTPVAGVYPDPPTHGHAPSPKDLPGAPGIIETPAPGVVAAGPQGPGLTSTYLPRI